MPNVTNSTKECRLTACFSLKGHRTTSASIFFQVESFPQKSWDVCTTRNVCSDCMLNLTYDFHLPTKNEDICNILSAVIKKMSTTVMTVEFDTIHFPCQEENVDVCFCKLTEVQKFTVYINYDDGFGNKMYTI